MTERSPAEDLRDYFPFGFATSDEAWRRHEIDDLLIADAPFSGDNLRYAVRRLAQRLAEERSRRSYPTPEVRAERLLALGTLADALRYLARTYLRANDDAVARGRAFAERKIGGEIVAGINHRFAELYPPGEVQIGRIETESYLARGEAPAHVTVELILLFMNMANPATRPYRELFDDQELQRRASYVPYVVALEEFFAQEPPSVHTGMTLFSSLRAPMLAAPDSLEGQLAYIREHWAGLLPAELLARLDLARDLLREEDVFRGVGFGPPPVLEFGPGTAGAYDGYAEPESFSRDADWMSNVVLIAKSTYVWLDQLAKKYRREITRLDQIPDEELDRLARWGISGLWLIGLWERSRASRTIKQWMGNPEAVASAYSLYDYVIAADLGGEAAYENLRRRASARGIRLASDMVPNHMAIDSRWVVEHPDWFLQRELPPYPAYSFSCEDLCDHPDVAVRIEDGYWRHSDAAVVFQRVDQRTGETRYIYHGNDGTSMPWNDTAQLDFTRADVREAVIQTILHVARRFPIIRFDAAMTLAKKHYQRLWFPAPGDAGAIPSRAECGMTRARFDEIFPREFWREVVDRVAAEVPETLLLAEAFWLMEGYFVRTLGMHRVYNSAFMNMLKMEENQKYRQTIKNVLEFSPQVLKRFVNFMNNPDERTAVEQFGKGDKYFGVAILMATMPGLPMFGHGQIEGFAEKYGMEYRRAYWDEPVDEDMVRRHEREIFPLLHRRVLFSGAENFAIYDFVRPDGNVDENVFAYSNRYGDDRALILYNNAYGSTAGRIQTASAINAGAADDPQLVRRDLNAALGLRSDARLFYAFRDVITGQEYLHHSHELAAGFGAELNGYRYQVFLHWRELGDADGVWARVHARLGGRPVPDLERARRELELEPVLDALARELREALAAIPVPRSLADRGDDRGDDVEQRGAPGRDESSRAEPTEARTAGGEPPVVEPADVEPADVKPTDVKPADAKPTDAKPTDAVSDRESAGAAGLYQALPNLPVPALSVVRSSLHRAACEVSGQPERAATVAAKAPVPDPRAAELLVQRTATVLAEWRGAPDAAAAVWPAAQLAGVLAWHGGLVRAFDDEGAAELLRGLRSDPVAVAYLGINHHEGHDYLRQESLAQWLAAEVLMSGEESPRAARKITAVLDTAQASGYRLGPLAAALETAGAKGNEND